MIGKKTEANFFLTNRNISSILLMIMIIIFKMIPGIGIWRCQGKNIMIFNN